MGLYEGVVSFMVLRKCFMGFMVGLCKGCLQKEFYQGVYKCAQYGWKPNILRALE